MTSIAERYQHVRSQIRHAIGIAGRPKGCVQLLAVSKTKPAEDIAALYRLGQRHFAENYLQEARSKQQKLAAFNITWHFIGPIQSNKTSAIAHYFDWVHSVDRLKIAQRLSEQRPAHLPPLNVCLQVNISGEASKSGVTLTELPDLAQAIALLPNLVLRGVMAIPAPEDNYARQRQPYRALYQALQALEGLSLDTYSFGMSGDLKAAVMEGSTLVRVGTALFGERHPLGDP
ncbi:MAG: YggS family pyridoxal phosphate-dependent enzyme [Methylomonas sp.]|nr:YggS family pyridoxal phosphate-dependent enzyme [Methylomonas sp.]PPD22630.1 MAG: YggS family pyridoxal phosphate-dependent enzyme [Methylomonas sp.]PPD27942.1 MAG: YggS family pyridoxal phosphate-dependent enzyme [Methylomonas sp.]PPD40051.1 MAG: YggS family pyridoxal phosphate-dependent enzyme [Methylomonas sp.]PPD41561.1 MAG: YggS family pyridoxal phosphate-dependent enzyme [Methylomonas sp.]